MKYISLCICLLILSYSLNSCANNHKSVTESKQNLGSMKIERFDKDFYDYLENPTDETENLLEIKYPNFLKAFTSVTVDKSDLEPSDSLFFEPLKQYFSNNILRSLYSDELNTFSDLSNYEEELTVANDLVNKNFSGKFLPRFGIHVSGFKANTIVLDDYISISGDKYLGYHQMYNQFFEPYVLLQMQSKYITRDLIRAWLYTEFKESNERKSLLSEMIYQGKILFALQKLLPNWSEAEILAYTDSQLKWNNDNNKDIWKKVLNQNHLFSTDFFVIQKYMMDAPYTATISNDSPGRVGDWLGLQIIKSYVDNTNTSLSDLLKEKDNQKILKEAKYNP